VTSPERGGERTVAVLTTGRQDWGILRSSCRAIASEPGLRLALAAGGMHLSGRHGHTVDGIRADGFEPAVTLAWLPDSDGASEPSADAQAASALASIGGWLRASDPDVLLLVGDRLETAAAALAATLVGVPIAHLHGGEQSLGSFDDALRHAITKLAHLHLVSHELHARRVIAMGEDPASVHVVGAPGLDNLARSDLPDRAELEALTGITLEPPVVVVTVHPATLDADPTAAARAVAAAMDAVEATYLVTLPNVDPGGADIATVMRAAAASGPRRVVVPALGERNYWGVLRIADAMLGNSSSGLIEAPALRLPVINVGDRQEGRRREANVLDAPADAWSVSSTLRRALAPEFRAGIPAPDSRLADGRAGERVARIIAAWHPRRPPRKAPVRIPP
jgi:UDP-hydrolysing UDP-N-acetyl-D-glucosamine 2-epimerase